MFIDEIKIFARAGHGGKGCVAFLRETFRPKGGPSGGNGGRGGNVILQADHDLNNLIAQYYQPRLLAQNGEHGLGKGMDGHAGQDLLVKVPCGTLVWRLASTKSAAAPEEEDPRPSGSKLLRISTGKRPTLRYAGRERAVELDLEEDKVEQTTFHPHEKGELVADVTEHGQQFVLCKGGRGGLGNRNFATAARQTPRFAQPGEAGEEGDFLLELRLIADVGLVGYPNAGKSTLLTAISKARPKIAPYPFTTLHPQIGIVEYPDWHRLTVCDVPGLIERCKILVLLLDMAGSDGRQPWDDYRNLLNELGLYDPALLERPRVVAANKMDEPVAEENLKKFKRKIRKTPVLPIAAAFDEGIERFKKTIRETVELTASSKV